MRTTQNSKLKTQNSKLKIDIVATTNLNANLVRSILLPLLGVPQVRRVIWISDRPGPPLSRVRYVAPRQPAPTGLLRLLLRIPMLAAQIVRRRPALVMACNLMPHGLVVFALARLLGRKVCIHVIGGANEVIGGGFAMDKRIRRPVPALEALYLAVLRHTDLVVVIGSAARAYLESQGVAPTRIAQISSKVDPARFCPQPGLVPDYDLVIAAALIPLKRVDLFLRIVAALKADFPAIRAAVLGDGPLRGELVTTAARLGLAGAVDFLGFQEQPEAYYRRAKVFVLTSSTEGLSLAMMEAMACGLPVVVSDVGDLGEVARDGETGYRIPPNDEAGYVAACARLLADADLRARLGTQARAAILAGYTVADGTRAWAAALARLA